MFGAALDVRVQCPSPTGRQVDAREIGVAFYVRLPLPPHRRL